MHEAGLSDLRTRHYQPDRATPYSGLRPIATSRLDAQSSWRATRAAWTWRGVRPQTCGTAGSTVPLVRQASRQRRLPRTVQPWWNARRSSALLRSRQLLPSVHHAMARGAQGNVVGWVERIDQPTLCQLIGIGVVIRPMVSMVAAVDTHQLTRSTLVLFSALMRGSVASPLTASMLAITNGDLGMLRAKELNAEMVGSTSASHLRTSRAAGSGARPRGWTMEQQVSMPIPAVVMSLAPRGTERARGLGAPCDLACHGPSIPAVVQTLQLFASGWRKQPNFLEECAQRDRDARKLQAAAKLVNLP
jgi:hypothetical protein